MRGEGERKRDRERETHTCTRKEREREIHQIVDGGKKGRRQRRERIGEGTRKG